ncbi:MAG: hypothetical protein IJ134_01660 [Bacilli bacterium]|nr:hypothetical protein [Bacilli bacterium]
MNYIYDILLNFNKMPYDFYEWNKSDYITHIRKIPIFKVSEKVLYELLNNDVCFSEMFLQQIKNKSEMFTKKGIRNIKYAFVVSDATLSLALYLDNKGNTIKISKLLIDEDIEVCDIATCIITSNIKYTILNQRKIEKFKTRKDLDIENKIYSNLNKIINKKNILEMQYLFYECFNIKKENINEMYNIFMKQMQLNFDKIAPKLNNIFNLLTFN